MTEYEEEIAELDGHLRPFLRPDFFFVNVGASDGVVADPIFPFIERYGWHGIVVEPVPYVFAQLQENYRHLENVIFERAAISEESRSFWYIEEGSGSIDYVMKQIGSLSKERVLETLAGLRALKAHVARVPAAIESEGITTPVHEGPTILDDAELYLREIEVPCISFNDLMRKHRVDHIDFLNIDAEGYDLEIFHSIDFDAYRPQVLCIETEGHSNDEQEDVRARLRSLDYEWRQQFGLFSGVYVQPSPRQRSPMSHPEAS